MFVLRRSAPPEKQRHVTAAWRYGLEALLVGRWPQA
jgi:hypothetical protein